MFLSILEQSCVFLPLALGIYLSYGVLKIADLTTDGSFVLGAGLYAIVIGFGMPPIVGMCCAICGGLLAGVVVSLLQTRLQLNPLIAGILLVFILNTLTLKIMGKPNISLFNHPSIFGGFSKMTVLVPIAMCLLMSGTGLLASRLGLMLQAFGNQPTLLHLCGKNSHSYRMLGLSLSNGLVGCSGALTAQINGYADVGMGTGVVLIALGTVIIGQQIYSYVFQRPSCASFLRLLCCFLAIVLYFLTVQALLALGLDPIYLRLMIGLCLIAFLGMTQKQKVVS